MKKNLIVRIGEGLGNQLFMYANAYSLSKKFDCNLYIDDESGFSKNKRSRFYNLNIFDGYFTTIKTCRVASKNFTWDSHLSKCITRYSHNSY